MNMKSSKIGRLAGIGTILSLVTCYGTLALVGVLGALGITIAVNNAIWAGAIVGFAVLAVIGLALGYRRHHKPAALIIGLTGAALISYTMLADYSRVIELSGFALLALAAFWDRRVKAEISQ